jgi:hypothetical protein
VRADALESLKALTDDVEEYASSAAQGEARVRRARAEACVRVSCA